MTGLTLDPQFPQIPKVLEAGFMREIFQDVLIRNHKQGNRKFSIEKCEVGEKRYKPGKNFTLSYKLRLQDLESKDSYDQLLTAQLCSLDSRQTELNNFPDGISYSINGIPSVSFVSEVGMLLWAFPHDRKLVHLSKLLDTEHLASVVSKNLSGLKLSPSENIVSVKSDVVHYLPEQSCMIRYTIDVAATQENQKSGLKEIIVYGKNYRDDNGLETYAIMKQLADQSPHCARPLHYDTDTNTLWQAQVPGVPFEWTTKLSENHSLIQMVAGCIASFHRSKVNSSRQYGVTQINEQLNSAVKMAASWNVSLGEKVKETVCDLLLSHSLINWNNSIINAPLHLDLKMGNLLISKDKAYLIDMDCVSLGDHLADTGSFIANLYLNGIRAGSGINEIDEVVSIFIKEYCIALDFDVDTFKLSWYIAAALIHEVLRRSLRQQSQERLKYLDDYIALSRRYNALCLKGIEHV